MPKINSIFSAISIPYWLITQSHKSLYSASIASRGWCYKLLSDTGGPNPSWICWFHVITVHHYRLYTSFVPNACFLLLDHIACIAYRCGLLLQTEWSCLSVCLYVVAHIRPTAFLGPLKWTTIILKRLDHLTEEYQSLETECCYNNRRALCTV